MNFQQKMMPLILKIQPFSIPFIFNKTLHYAKENNLSN